MAAYLLYDCSCLFGDILAMTIGPTKINGEKGWCLDARSLGRGRLYFHSKEAAQTEFQTLTAQGHVDRETWTALPPAQRAETLTILKEIGGTGLTLRQVWEQHSQRAKPAAIVSLDRAIAETVASKRAAGRRETSIRALDYYLNLFARGRGGKPIHEIGTNEIEEWFASRSEAPQTRQSNTGCLSSLFSFCWRKNYIKENPCQRLEKITIGTKAPKILTLDQCQKALAWTMSQEPKFLAWLVLTLLVGLRPKSEAAPLTWEDIDLDRHCIRIEMERTKTHRHRIIDLSLSPPALPWLIVAKASQASLPIPYSTRRKFLRRLRGYLGLKAWPQDILRHTAASNLLAYHQDAGKISHFLGNSAGVLLKRYKALIYREEAEKWFALLPPAPCPTPVPL